MNCARFQQVMANLLSNACKYSQREGEVQLGVSLTAAHQVRIDVRDFGPGIPEQFRERIFQKFAQADASDTRSRGGSGLGLSITKAIVLQMQGQIGYHSVPGEGSCFFVEFPVFDADLKGE